jgi:LacI family transcriptional regulator
MNAKIAGHSREAEVMRAVGNRTRATLRDVALAAGVHPATASRALNPATEQRVSRSTKRRVRDAAKALGYQPNALARGLKTHRSMSIAMLVPDLTNPTMPALVSGVERELGANGYSALLADTENDPEMERFKFQALQARHVDGFVIATAHRQDPLLEQAAAAGVPLVLVVRRVDHATIPSVTADERSGMDQAVGHLAALGHERVAHIAIPTWTSVGADRLAAFHAAMARYGLPVDERLVVECQSYREDDGAAGLRDLLDRSAPFTAVVAGNDVLALGCYGVMEERGIRCPAELSLVGYNDIPFIRLLRPPLTSVRVPYHDIGREAARLLLERLREPGTPPKSLSMVPELVPRGSTTEPRR